MSRETRGSFQRHRCEIQRVAMSNVLTVKLYALQVKRKGEKDFRRLLVCLFSKRKIAVEKSPAE